MNANAALSESRSVSGLEFSRLRRRLAVAAGDARFSVISLSPSYRAGGSRQQQQQQR